MARKKTKKSNIKKTNKNNTKKKTNVNKKNEKDNNLNNKTTVLNVEDINKKLNDKKTNDNIKEETKNEIVNNKKQTKHKKNDTKVKSKQDLIPENKLYKEAEKLYKSKKYDEAYNLYIKVLSEFKDKNVYKRLIECLTRDFTYKENTKEFNKLYNDYLVSYKILINKKETNILEKKLEEYKNIKPIKSKSKFVLIALLGVFGIHKFLEKKYILGIIYLLTFGIFGIGVIYDLINDYVIYENDFQVDVVRYIISIIMIVIAILNINSINFYYLIIASILFMPFVFSKLLYLIPGIIKIIIFIILICLVFNKKTVIESIPLNLIGTWETSNENTNFVSIKIKSDKSTIKFNDRDTETGLNEYDNNTKIFKVYINATTYYKFIMDKDEKNLCIYNDSKTCNVAFSKK